MGAEAGERGEEEPQGDEGQTALQPSSCADGTTAQARSQGKNQAWGGLRDSPRRLQCSGTAPAATEAWSTRSSTTGSSRHAGTGRSVRCKQGSGARRTGGCAKRAGLQCGMDVFRKETTSTAAQPSDPVCARGGGSSQTPGSGTRRKGTRAPEKREGPRPQHRGRGDAACTAEHARTRAHDTPGKDGSAAAQAVSFQGLRGGPARALTTSLLPSRLRGKRGTRTPEYLVLWLHRPNATGQPRVCRPQWVPDHGPLPQAFRVSHAHRARRCRHPSMQSSPISWQPTKSNGPDI